MAINIKSPAELTIMREAGRIVAQVLQVLEASVRPGISTGELDEIARREAERRGAVPSFLGYHGFPGAICASVNDEVVHGIPSRRRVLRDGDIVSIDFGAIYQGWQGDAAITVPVGRASPEVARLLAVTRGALAAGIEQARPGNRLGDISHAIQTYAEARGLGVVRQYVGHGIGRKMHEDPQIPNFGPPGRGPKLRAGMTLAIEPMMNLGTPETIVLPDEWTVVTQDGKYSAHFEHTVAVGPDGPQILTLS